MVWIFLSWIWILLTYEEQKYDWLLYMQALLAVGVGAAYAAPYLGRMVALGKPGMENIQEMQV